MVVELDDFSFHGGAALQTWRAGERVAGEVPSNPSAKQINLKPAPSTSEEQLQSVVANSPAATASVKRARTAVQERAALQEACPDR